MTRMKERSRFWVPTGALVLALVTALSTPYLARAATRSGDRVPRALWKTYPLDPSGGHARIEKQPAGSDESRPPRKEQVAPTTSVAGKGAAHLSQQQSSGHDPLRVIAIGLVAALVLLAVTLATRSASRGLRDIAGALPTNTIMLYASVIFVSVMVGIGVTLILSPALGL
jgi:hypothetical protein